MGSRQPGGERRILAKISAQAQAAQAGMLIEFNNLKALLNPDREDIRIQNAISTLHTTIKQAKNAPVAVSPIPTLAVIRDEYMDQRSGP